MLFTELYEIILIELQNYRKQLFSIKTKQYSVNIIKWTKGYCSNTQLRMPYSSAYHVLKLNDEKFERIGVVLFLVMFVQWVLLFTAKIVQGAFH